MSAPLEKLGRYPRKKSQTLKIETRVPPQRCTKTFAPTGCVCLHLCHFLTITVKKKQQTASASGRDLRHPTELHGCAHGRQRTAHEPDQTPVCRRGEKCSRPPPAAPAVTKRRQRRFRKKGGKESVFLERGDAGEQTGGVSSWICAMHRFRCYCCGSCCCSKHPAHQTGETRVGRRERAAHLTTETQRMDLHDRLFTLANIYRKRQMGGDVLIKREREEGGGRIRMFQKAVFGKRGGCRCWLTTAFFKEVKIPIRKRLLWYLKTTPITSTCSKRWPIRCILHNNSLAVVKDQLIEAKMSVKNCWRLKRQKGF